jgi:IS5 family transposase
VPQVTQAANDKQQLTPMLERLTVLPEELPKPKKLTADAGYFSEANVNACEEAGIEPSIAIKRDEHHPHCSERFENQPSPAADATPVERMTYRLKTAKGRATYALRKQTVEPVFGIIKSVMGFRQFLTRGLDNVQNEWTLVCLAWNSKRMAALRPQ